jgi:hypothetical protein
MVVRNALAVERYASIYEAKTTGNPDEAEDEAEASPLRDVMALK